MTCACQVIGGAAVAVFRPGCRNPCCGAGCPCIPAPLPTRLRPRSSSISARACSLLVLLVVFAFRAVFPSTIGKLKLLDIMIGDHLESYSGGAIWFVEVVNAVKSHGHAVPRVSHLVLTSGEF